ncbi:uncharacterized protein E0L32_010716 [Thyridium curvatum]|uniref:Uncharacterized protein n=1 Tax=Thyridium curvatum TaxID=1093900 RepID=A0A507AKR9_9PEZI|nr:uncharacterized protein E0L32_010716 [Thyridium curvatum]TPX07617.1 hypothetical protein E0L32_010716 [Thyridium curvatum]
MRLSPLRNNIGLRLMHTQRRRPPLAFAFDIDGVLVHGPSVLPEAKRALAILNGENKQRIKIPYVLMTNGGGSTEADRAARLSQDLGLPVQSSQVILSHTVVRSFAHKYADDPVLVLGGINDAIRKVAEDYGFKKAYSALDVLASNPSVFPHYHMTSEEMRAAKRFDLAKTAFRAVFLFCDSRNWGLDTQVMVDVLRSRGGVIGNPYRAKGDLPNVELVFCNPDLLWRNDFTNHRFSMGLFKESFQAVYKLLTGETYPYKQYGKPAPQTYSFAKDVLSTQADELGGLEEPSSSEINIYMVGGELASD